MAEIKNSFLRSKMNKDLDDRLIPNGEYRDAKNISVGKSESDDIGSLENIIGNDVVTNFGFTGLEVIGYYADEAQSRFYVFLTDSTQTLLNVANPSTGIGSNCHICMWSLATGPVTLVSGSFLNFSIAFPMTGVSLVENLLFFTDNRNQPRKINIDRALGYYTEENHISVAKYNPYQAISLIKRVKTKASAASTISSITVDSAVGIEIGMQLVSTSSTGTEAIEAKDFIYVTGISGSTISLSENVVVALDDILYFLVSTMTNKADEDNWPGDPDYIEDKFIRLSYRFQFDDGEYSIVAPFTQIAYIPKQKGYYINGDEEAAYRSTILDWMENSIDNIVAQILFPDVLSNCTPSAGSSYKINNLEILYKESDGLAIKVLDTINFAEQPSGWIGTTDTNVYSYNYQSRKPFKTLSTGQTTRVYDKVPTRALAQEIAGNRVIYANYRDKYTPPSTLNYEVAVTEKQDLGTYDSWIEYPNHSLKQNRNYQVGFVLCDKFGRQSDVILSDINTTTSVQGNIIYRGSTIYSPYNSNVTESVIKDWFGDSLAVIIRGVISSGINNSPNQDFSQPGLYAIPLGEGSQIQGRGFNVAGNTTTFPTSKQYQFTLNTATNTGQSVPIVGSYLKGKFTDYVEVTNVNITSVTTYLVTCDGDIDQDFYSLTIPAITPDPKFAYTINERGWYSYKVVVKQQEQDYYNVYLPGVLNGYPQQPDQVSVTGTTLAPVTNQNLSIASDPSNNQITTGMEISGVGVSGVPTIESVTTLTSFVMSSSQLLPTSLSLTFKSVIDYGLFPTNEDGKTANIVLINDNINKVPRDLAEVGPDQKQFRSSVQLYGRVQNTATGNIQYFPGSNTDTVVSISTANDSNMTTSSINTIGQNNLYQFDSNPLIGRISTNDPIGVTSADMVPHLAIYETDPVDSVLDIFWESTTVGLISDLNSDVVTDSVGPYGVTGFVSSFDETYTPGTAVSTEFTVVSLAGTPINLEFPLTDGVITTTDETGASRDVFELVLQSNVAGQGTKYKIHLKSGYNPVFLYNSPSVDVFTTEMIFTDSDGVSSPPFARKISLVNIKPTVTSATLSNNTVIPTITLSQNFVGTVLDTSGNNPIIAVNGTVYASEVSSQIKYTATSTNSGMTYFSVNPSSGVLTRNSTPIPLGIYVLTVSAQDAWNEALDLFAIGENAATSSMISDPVTLTIIIGAIQVNPGIIGECIDSSNNFMSAGTYRTTGSLTSVPNPIDGCWYLAANTLTKNDLPDAWRIAAPNYATQSQSGTFPFANALRLGGANGFAADALKKGTVVFKFNISQKFAQAQSGFGTFLDFGIDSLLVFYRAEGAPQGAWTLATDINGVLSNAILLAASVSNPTFNTSKYLQYVFAFDTPGEYAIVARGLSTTQQGSSLGTDNDHSQVQMWVTSGDLNNDTCVIVPGANLQGTPSATINYTSTATPKAYRYFINTTPQATFTCSAAQSANNSNYSQVAYPEYVTQFYNSAALTTVLTPANWTTVNNFYNFNVSKYITSTGSEGAMPQYEPYKFTTSLTNDTLTSVGAVVDQGVNSANVLNCNSATNPSSTITQRVNQ